MLACLISTSPASCDGLDFQISFNNVVVRRVSVIVIVLFSEKSGAHLFIAAARGRQLTAWRV
jgi:hypothetical protein